MLKAKLIVVGGDAKAGEVNLKLPSTIGRGREASIVLPHPLVSRLHCEFYEKEGKLFVKDLGSLNGTFINNDRITGEHVLEPQQLLTLGDVTFRASYEFGVEVQQEEMQAACAGDGSVQNLETQPAPNDPAPVIEVANQPAAPCEKETMHDKSIEQPEENSAGSTIASTNQAIKGSEMKAAASKSTATLSCEVECHDVTGVRAETDFFSVDLGSDLQGEHSESGSKIGSRIRMPR